MRGRLLLGVFATCLLTSCSAQLLGGPVGWDSQVDYTDVQGGSALLPAGNSMYSMQAAQPLQQSAAGSGLSSTLLGYMGRDGMPASQQPTVSGTASDPHAIIQQLLAQQQQNKPTPWPQALDPTGGQGDGSSSSSTSSVDTYVPTVPVTPGHPAMNWGNSWDNQYKQYDPSTLLDSSSQLAQQNGYYYPDSYNFESARVNPGSDFELPAVPEEQKPQQPPDQQQHQTSFDESSASSDSQAASQQDFDQLFSAMLSATPQLPKQDSSTTSSSSTSSHTDQNTSNGNSSGSSSAAPGPEQLVWQPASGPAAPQVTSASQVHVNAEQQPTQQEPEQTPMHEQHEQLHDEQQWHTYVEQQPKDAEQQQPTQQQQQQPPSLPEPVQAGVTLSTDEVDSDTSSSGTAVASNAVNLQSAHSNDVVSPAGVTTPVHDSPTLEVASMPAQDNGSTDQLPQGFADYEKVRNAANALLFRDVVSNSTAPPIEPAAAASATQHRGIKIGASIGIAVASCIVTVLAVAIARGVMRRVRSGKQGPGALEVSMGGFFARYSVDSGCDVEAAKVVEPQKGSLDALHAKRRLAYGSDDGTLCSHGGLAAEWWISRHSSCSDGSDAARDSSPMCGRASTPLAKQHKG